MITLLVVAILGLTLFLADLGVANAEGEDPTSTPTIPAAIECKVDGVTDSDGDGLDDGLETSGTLEIGNSGVFVKTDPCKKDTDGDDLSDSEELRGTGPGSLGLLGPLLERIGVAKTDPTMHDHDGDGVSDGDEWLQYTILLDGEDSGKEIIAFSNPTKKDTDGDSLGDFIERMGWVIKVNGEDRRVKSSPLDSDTDEDGLTDKEEFDVLETLWGTFRTDPTHTDTDGDGLKDEVEIKGLIPLNPNMKDTDGDGLGDKKEVDHPECHADRVDTDGDGRADRLSSEGVLKCGSYDQDQDGLPDRLSDPTEIIESTVPKKLDTDSVYTAGGQIILRPGVNQSSDTSTVEKLESEIVQLEGDLLDNARLIENYKRSHEDSSLKIDWLEGEQLTASEKTDSKDAGTGSSSLIILVLVVAAGGIALILGVGIGRVMGNGPATTDHLLRREAEEDLKSDPDFRRKLSDEIRQVPVSVEQDRQRVISQLNQERGISLQGSQSDLMVRLNSTRAELRGAVAATNRGIPDAMLEEAESLISPVSDNDRWAENLAVASSLIRNVSRYYLGHT
jgi:hypothetical protein